MGTTYVLSRPQRAPSCRINSAFAGAYITNNPELLKGNNRPKLSAHLELLNLVTTLMGAVQSDLPLVNETLNQLNTTMSEKKWLDEAQIRELNNLIQHNEPIRRILRNYLETMGEAAKKLGPEDDYFGLLASYTALQEEENNPQFQAIETIIDASEQYLNETYQDHQKIHGLMDNEAELALKNDKLIQQAKTEDFMITSSPTEYYFTEEDTSSYIDTLFNDNESELLIQLTTAGHSTVFGKKEGKYWQFDSLGHASIGEGVCVCTTLTVYDNKEEALEAMKVRAQKSESEFSKITVALSPAAIIALEKTREKERVRLELTREIANLMGSLKENQQGFANSVKLPLEKRYDSYKQQHDKLIALKQSLDKLTISDNQPALIASKKTLSDSINNENEKQEKLLKDMENAKEIVAMIESVPSEPPVKTEEFQEALGLLEINMQILDNTLKENPIAMGILKEEIDNYLRDILLNQVFLPWADAVIPPKQSLTKKYTDEKLPELIGQIEKLQMMIEFLEKYKYQAGTKSDLVESLDNISGMQGAMIEQMKKVRESLINELPKEQQILFKDKDKKNNQSNRPADDDNEKDGDYLWPHNGPHKH